MGKIEAVVVNHNTSLYTELLLRSFYDKHAVPLDVSMTVLDNNSEDDMSMLESYASQKSIAIVKTRWNTRTETNTHGEVLREFVLTHPNCEHYLFLDADACFCEENTVHAMMDELEKNEDVFGVQARMSWDGVNPVPEDAYWKTVKTYMKFKFGVGKEPDGDVSTYGLNIAAVGDRCHPFCCLIRNSEVFRMVVEKIGLSAYRSFAETDGKGFDTFGMMTQVMNTHKLRHIVSSKMVIHFCGVSYNPKHYSGDDNSALKTMQKKRCLELLERLRGSPGEKVQRISLFSPPPPSPSCSMN
ncbi:MAG: hypothetical protein V1809_13375 [Planctomycetota bacterium]